MSDHDSHDQAHGHSHQPTGDGAVVDGESHDHDHAHGHDDAGRSHGHDHAHGHSHSHSHAISADADARWLWIALTLIGVLMAVEVSFAIVANSLALLADAAHMLTDAAAIGLSIWVARLAKRPPEGRSTFGMRRAEILSAQANGATLGALGLLLLVHSIERLVNPIAVTGGIVSAVAGFGIVVNVLAVAALSRANRQSLNVEGSFQHLVTDLYAFIGTLIAGLVIVTTGFDRADALASLAVSGLMLRSALGLLKATSAVVLEQAPARLAPELVGPAMVAVPHVVEVHDLHVWELVPGDPLLSAHVLVEADADCHVARQVIERMLADRFDLHHTTLQVDHASHQLMQLASPGAT